MTQVVSTSCRVPYCVCTSDFQAHQTQPIDIDIVYIPLHPPPPYFPPPAAPQRGVSHLFMICLLALLRTSVDSSSPHSLAVTWWNILAWLRAGNLFHNCLLNRRFIQDMLVASARSTLCSVNSMIHRWLAIVATVAVLIQLWPDCPLHHGRPLISFFFLYKFAVGWLAIVCRTIDSKQSEYG